MLYISDANMDNVLSTSVILIIIKSAFPYFSLKKRKKKAELLAVQSEVCSINGVEIYITRAYTKLYHVRYEWPKRGRE